MSEPDGNGLKIGYGKASLSATGPITVLVVLVAMQVVSTIWGFSETRKLATDGFRQQTAEHTALIRNDRILACVLSIPPDQRDKLRVQSTVAWDLWCPGIMRDGDRMSGDAR